MSEYVLFIFNEKKKFHNMGNNQGAVDTINTLEEDGLGLVITTKMDNSPEEAFSYFLNLSS